MSKENPSAQYLKARLGNLGELWEQCRQNNAFFKANFPDEENVDQSDKNIYDPRRFKEAEQAYYDCTDYILENLPDMSEVQKSEPIVKVEKSFALKLPRISIPTLMMHNACTF